VGAVHLAATAPKTLIHELLQQPAGERCRGVDDQEAGLALWEVGAGVRWAEKQPK